MSSQPIQIVQICQDPNLRRKKKAIGAATSLFIVGTICLVVRSVNLTNDYSYRNYQYNSYSGLLASGIICICTGAFFLIYAFILHARIQSARTQQAGSIIVAGTYPPNQGVPGYPVTHQQFGNYNTPGYPPQGQGPPMPNYPPNQVPSGYPQSYPYHGSGMPGQNYPQAAGGIAGQNPQTHSAPYYQEPVDPPPPYVEPKRY